MIRDALLWAGKVKRHVCHSISSWVKDYGQNRLTLEKMSPVSLERLLRRSTREEKLFSSKL